MVRPYTGFGDKIVTLLKTFDTCSNSHSHEVQYFFYLTFNLLPNTTKVYLTNPRNAITHLLVKTVCNELT